MFHIFIIWACVDTLFLVLGIISNSLTITVFCRGKQSPKSDFRVLTLNLCAADLVLTVTLINNHTFFNINWAEAEYISLCRFMSFIRLFGIFASPYANFAIAIQRTLVIFRPAWNHRRSTLIVLVVTWLLTFLSGIDGLITATIVHEEYENSSYTYTYCDLDHEGTYYGMETFIWLFFIRLLLPTLGIVILYLILLIKVCRNWSTWNNQQDSSAKHKNRVYEEHWSFSLRYSRLLNMYDEQSAVALCICVH